MEVDEVHPLCILCGREILATSDDVTSEEATFDTLDNGAMYHVTCWDAGHKQLVIA